MSPLVLFLLLPCVAGGPLSFPPRKLDPVPPPLRPIPHNTMHALYFDATRQAYVQHAFAVLKVARAEWKKALERALMLPLRTPDSQQRQLDSLLSSSNRMIRA